MASPQIAELMLLLFIILLLFIVLLLIIKVLLLIVELVVELFIVELVVELLIGNSHPLKSLLITYPELQLIHKLELQLKHPV